MKNTETAIMPAYKLGVGMTATATTYMNIWLGQINIEI